MPIPLAIPLIASGISALGGLFGNKKQTQQQTQNTSGQTDSTGNTLPFYDPANLGMRDTLLDYYRQSLDKDPNLEGYQANGIAQIQQGGNARVQALKNSLAGRGLSYSPTAAIAPAMAHGQTIGDISSFANSVPLLADKLRQDRLSQAAAFQRSIPIGQQTWGTQKSTSQSTGTGTQSGNPVAGGLVSAGTTLAGLYGRLYGGRGGGGSSPGYGNWDDYDS